MLFLVVTHGGQRLTVLKNVGGQQNRATPNIIGKQFMKVSVPTTQMPTGSTISQPLAAAIVQQWKSTQSSLVNSSASINTLEIQNKIVETEFYMVSFINKKFLIYFCTSLES